MALKAEVGKIGDGVSKLLERDAKRPKPLGLTTVAATCGGLAAIAFVGWWLIGTSPAVVSIEKRLDKLDDADTGRVTRLEKEIGWSPRIVRDR